MGVKSTAQMAAFVGIGLGSVGAAGYGMTRYQQAKIDDARQLDHSALWAGTKGAVGWGVGGAAVAYGSWFAGMYGEAAHSGGAKGTAIGVGLWALSAASAGVAAGAVLGSAIEGVQSL